MNFEDLLDEDGQGTRELDAWLAENIAESGYEIMSGFAGTYTGPKKYTTGDSIDLIWNLAKEYFNHIEIRYESGSVFCVTRTECPQTDLYDDGKIAIAEALFKAYQEKEDGE